MNDAEQIITGVCSRKTIAAEATYTCDDGETIVAIDAPYSGASVKGVIKNGGGKFDTHLSSDGLTSGNAVIVSGRFGVWLTSCTVSAGSASVTLLIRTGL